MKRGTLLTILAIIAFGALLLFNTLSAQKATCTVTVTYNGRTNTATASHENEAEARRSAQNTACGPITSGMNDAIACDRVQPDSVRCETR
jgi:hypothetical protein